MQTETCAALFSMRIGCDTEELEELQRRREDELLAPLTTDAQPPDAELVAAPLINGWRLSVTDTAGLYVRGTRDGQDFTTDEVVEIDALRRWVRDRGGVRIPAATIAACLDAGSADEAIHADYPTLPAGACDVVRRWRSDTRRSTASSDWISPLPPGLPRGQIVYDTHERAGGRVTYASVVNGSYQLRGGDWHYDLHQIRNVEPAHPGQPLGASCRIGETFEDAMPFSLDHYELKRDPDESDEDYAARRGLFETARKTQK